MEGGLSVGSQIDEQLSDEGKSLVTHLPIERAHDGSEVAKISFDVLYGGRRTEDGGC